MKIFENSYNFFLSVGAGVEISRLCPDENIGRLSEAFAKADMNGYVDILATMAHEMSKAYEGRKALVEKDYIPNVLEKNAVRFLSYEELKTLESELIKAFNEDRKTSVKTAPKKNESEAKA